jgi:hypothetical protein
LPLQHWSGVFLWWGTPKRVTELNLLGWGINGTAAHLGTALRGMYGLFRLNMSQNALQGDLSAGLAQAPMGVAELQHLDVSFNPGLVVANPGALPPLLRELQSFNMSGCPLNVSTGVRYPQMLVVQQTLAVLVQHMEACNALYSADDVSMVLHLLLADAAARRVAVGRQPKPQQPCSAILAAEPAAAAAVRPGWDAAYLLVPAVPWAAGLIQQSTAERHLLRTIDFQRLVGQAAQCQLAQPVFHRAVW